MQRRICFCCMLALGAGAIPAAGQPSPSQTLSEIAPGDVISATKEAIQALPSAAKGKLLVRDLLGANVAGPGGSTVGTVENLVVIPGGRVIAAIISTKAKDSGRIPIPFAVVKVSHTAGRLGLTLPVGLSDLQGMKEIQSLASQLPGMR